MDALEALSVRNQQYISERRVVLSVSSEINSSAMLLRKCTYSNGYYAKPCSCARLRAR
jgi:hypothetical protein